jgi:hypothetical protein
MASLRPVTTGEAVNPELGPKLKLFLLEVQTNGESSYIKNLQLTEAAPSFEAASTCAEIARQFGAEELRVAFSNLVVGEHGSEVGQSAWKLIEYFDAVESQALDQYAACIQSRMA